MDIKTILSITARFLSTLLGYYFATVIVLALAVPGMGKYQIIFFSLLAGLTISFYGNRSLPAKI